MCPGFTLFPETRKEQKMNRESKGTTMIKGSKAGKKGTSK
jgi:hypothetical protein